MSGHLSAKTLWMIAGAVVVAVIVVVLVVVLTNKNKQSFKPFGALAQKGDSYQGHHGGHVAQAPSPVLDASHLADKSAAARAIRQTANSPEMRVSAQQFYNSMCDECGEGDAPQCNNSMKTMAGNIRLQYKQT